MLNRFKAHNFDGPMILQLSRLNKRSPDEVQNIFKNTLGLNSIVCLRVASVIDKLTPR